MDEFERSSAGGEEAEVGAEMTCTKEELVELFKVNSNFKIEILT